VFGFGILLESQGGVNMTRISEDIRLQMREDRESGMTLTQLIKKYKRSKSTVSWTVRGCDTSKVVWATRKKIEDVMPKTRPSLSKTDIGEAARQMICARLMLNGVTVFRPMTEDTPTDLLIMRRNGEVLKCQCKYIFPTATGKHNMSLFSIRKNGPTDKAVRHRYTLDEVDCFLGYCFDNDGVYVIPNAVTEGVQQLAFWVLRKSEGSCGKGLDTDKFLNKFDCLK
jgi:hypothetical protein